MNQEKARCAEACLLRGGSSGEKVAAKLSTLALVPLKNSPQLFVCNTVGQC